MQRERTMEQRVRRLERSNRVLVAVLIAGGAGALMLGQAGVDVPQFPLLRVERLEVVNPATGAVTATLGSDAEGGRLTMLARDGSRTTAFLGADADGGMLRVWTTDGTPVGFFGTDNDGGLLMLNMRNGQLGALVGVDEVGGLITVRDERNAFVAFRINEDGGVVKVAAHDAVDAAIIAVDAHGGGVLGLFEGQRPVLGAYGASNGGLIVLHDAEGRPTHVLTTNDAGEHALRPYHHPTDAARFNPPEPDGDDDGAPARRVPRF